MPESNPENVTRRPNVAADGEPQRTEDLVPLLYEELRRIASARMAKLPPGQTLQTTALVHEAYLRLAGDRDHSWDGRGHFFFAAARAMRDIMVEEARRKGSLKRGGDRKRIALEPAGISILPPTGYILGVNEAVEKLETQDPVKAQIVLLRYFIGLTSEETAGVMGLSISSVERKWRFVRAWLRRELADR